MLANRLFFQIFLLSFGNFLILGVCNGRDLIWLTVQQSVSLLLFLPAYDLLLLYQKISTCMGVGCFHFIEVTIDMEDYWRLLIVLVFLHTLIFCFVASFFGNNWIERKMYRSGFLKENTVLAKNKRAAVGVVRFYG